jgi:hypothetical protein
LPLADLLREPWERWQRETAERAAAIEEADRQRDAYRHSEELRRTVQALYLRFGGITTYVEHLRLLAQGDRAALELLLHDTRAMTGLEREAWGFFARRTTLDELGRPHAVHEEIQMSPEEREAVSSLRDAFLPQQKKALMRLRVKELCVMSRKEILPTYKIPALVRAPEGQVDHERGPPIAGEHPARRGQERPIPVAKWRPADRLSTRTWWRATAFSSWSSDTVASPVNNPVNNPTRRRGWSRQRIARHEGCYTPASNRAEPSIGSPQARRACSTDRATNRFREHLCRVGSTGLRDLAVGS